MIILINRKTAYKSRWYEKLYDKFWSSDIKRKSTGLENK